MLILTFISSIWNGTSHYIGKVSGIKQSRMMQKIEDMHKIEEEMQKKTCNECGRDII